MRTITVDQLRDLFSNVRGTTFATLVAVTDARARKTGNDYCRLGPIVKVAKVNVTVNAEHERSVNRQLVREGSSPTYEEQKTRSWGTRLGALIEHKGDYFIPAQINSVRSEPVYLAPQMVKGKVRLVPVKKAQVAPFLPSERTAERAAQQGVAQVVERRDFKLSSIAFAVLNGESYRVRA